MPSSVHRRLLPPGQQAKEQAERTVARDRFLPILSAYVM
jgi:hypothetical protein